MNVSKAAGLLIVAIVGFLIGMDAIRRNALSLRQSEALLRLVNIMALRIGEYRSPLGEIYADYADAELELNFCAWGFTGLLLSYCGDKHLDLDQISHQVCQLLQRNQSS